MIWVLMMVGGAWLVGYGMGRLRQRGRQHLHPLDWWELQELDMREREQARWRRKR